MAQANESTAKVCDFAMHETTRIGPIHHVLSANLLTKQISENTRFPGTPTRDPASGQLHVCACRSCVCLECVRTCLPLPFSLAARRRVALGIRPPPPRLGREQKRKVVRHDTWIRGRMRYETSRAVHIHMRMGRPSGTHAYSLLGVAGNEFYNTRRSHSTIHAKARRRCNGFLQANLPPASPERKKENRNPNEG